jgi:hypothetical protein
VAIVLVVVGALGSLQKIVEETGLEVVLQDTVVIVTTVTRYVAYRIHQSE